MNKAEALPESVDVIVLGTGLPECILAAACARIGLSVLHIDANENYGDLWASFSFEHLQAWIEHCKQLRDQECSGSPPISLADGELKHPVKFGFPYVSDICSEWHIPEDVADSDGTEEVKSQEINREFFDKRSRQFNVDLTPRVLLGHGSMTDTLIRSNVSRYLEFKFVDRILTYYDNQLQIVPLSRGDVFQTKQLTLVEKRGLIKFLTMCFRWQECESEWADFRNKPAIDFLKSRNLSAKVVHYLLNAFVMRSSAMTTHEYLTDVQALIKSFGAFGNPTPFLWPLYGCGDMAQAFSRSCAVYGGIYCLRCTVEAWITDSNWENVVAVLLNGQRVNCKNVISSVNYIPVGFHEKFLHKDFKTMRRGVLITTGSVMPDDKEHVSLLNLSWNDDKSHVVALEVCPSAYIVPKDLYSKPRLLWSLSYAQRFVNIIQANERSTCKNVIVTSFPGEEWTMDAVMDEVQQQFCSTWSDQEFLPTMEEPNETDDLKDIASLLPFAVSSEVVSLADEFRGNSDH